MPESISNGRLVWTATAMTIVFIAVSITAAQRLFADSLLNLYAGRWIVEHGIPRRDAFTIAGHGRDWIDQQWLSHVAYHSAWELGGYAAVSLLSTLAITSGFGVVTWLMIRRGVPGIQAVAWAGLALVVCMQNTFIRAQSFAYPLFAVVLALVLLDSRRPGFRWTWAMWLLGALVLWANLHGSLLLAIPFLSAYALVRAVLMLRGGDRRSGIGYGLTTLAVPCTVLVTPYGLDIVEYYISVLGNHTIAAYITEWRAANFGSMTSLPFLGFLIGIIALVAWATGRGKRATWTSLALGCWYGLIGTQALRYHAWAAFPGILLASELVRLPTSRMDLSDPHVRRRALRLLAPPAAVVVGAAAITAGVIVTQPDRDWLAETSRTGLAAAAEYLEEHPEAQVLADDPNSAALLWLFPDQVQNRIGYDGRLEVFRESDLRAFFTFVTSSSPDWLEATEDYEVLVVSRQLHPDTARRVAALDGWDELYSDERVVVVTRDHLSPK